MIVTVYRTSEKERMRSEYIFSESRTLSKIAHFELCSANSCWKIKRSILSHMLCTCSLLLTGYRASKTQHLC